MTTKFLPVPASFFGSQGRSGKSTKAGFRALLNLVENKLVGEDSHEKALGIINQEAREEPWLIVKYDPDTQDIILNIYCLGKSDYKIPPAGVGVCKANWMKNSPYNEMPSPVRFWGNWKVEKDLFFQAFAELHSSVPEVNEALKDLREYFPGDGVIAQKTYDLSCILSNQSITNDIKLREIEEYHRACVIEVGPTNSEIALKILKAFALTLFITVFIFSIIALGVYLAPISGGLSFVAVLALLTNVGTALGALALGSSCAAGLIIGGPSIYKFFQPSEQQKEDEEKIVSFTNALSSAFKS